MEMKGEACKIYTRALNDSLAIILVWNRFVSLNALFIYWAVGMRCKINTEIIANKSNARSEQRGEILFFQVDSQRSPTHALNMHQTPPAAFIKKPLEG